MDLALLGFPTRAPFGGGAAYNVAVARRVGRAPQWITAADYVASKLHTGRAPTALKVLRFSPRPPQEGLTSIGVGGEGARRVDPYSHDLIRRLVELRAELLGEIPALQCNDLAAARSVDAAQQAMKVTANSVAYGAPIEINVVTHPRQVWCTVTRPDATAYRCQSTRTEEPGRFFHPLIATLVAGGGRLLLTAAMRLVEDQGGTYAFCDTDSLFAVATEAGGLLELGDQKVSTLSWAKVVEIVDQFRTLNPFGGVLRGRSVLKVEDVNFDTGTGTQRELWCLAVASKRYALAVRTADGVPQLVREGKQAKRSEHGLGHLLPPRDPDPASDDKDWCDEWWLMLFRHAWGLPIDKRDWLNDPGLGRLTVTSVAEERAFRGYNVGLLTYRDRVRPWNFLMVAYPTHLERSRGDVSGTLVAPFESNPRRRLRAVWVDRMETHPKYRRVRTGAAAFVIDGVTAVRSYRDVFEEYRMHPESKAADSSRQQCAPWTVGQLQPLIVEASSIIRIGKETNRLAEDLAVLDDPEDRAIEYPERTCRGCGVTLRDRQRDWCSEACRKRSERSHATAR